MVCSGPSIPPSRLLPCLLFTLRVGLEQATKKSTKAEKSIASCCILQIVSDLHCEGQALRTCPVKYVQIRWMACKL